MILSRRKFLAGLGAAIAAPAIIRIPGILMPIKALVEPADFYLGRYSHLTYGAGYLVTEEEMDFTTNDLLAKLTRRYQAAFDHSELYGSAIA